MQGTIELVACFRRRKRNGEKLSYSAGASLSKCWDAAISEGNFSNSNFDQIVLPPLECAVMNFISLLAPMMDEDASVLGAHINDRMPLAGGS